MKKLKELSCLEKSKLRLVEIEAHINWIIHPLNDVLFDKPEDIKRQLRSILALAGTFPVSESSAKQLKRCPFCKKDKCENSLDISTEE